jgi:beta-lactamase regulating signal transducer with metallopeptidase domain
MIISWMLFASIIGALLTAGAFATERILGLAGHPRRFVWLTTIVVTAVWPILALVSTLSAGGSASEVPTRFVAAGAIRTVVSAPSKWDLLTRWTWVLVLLWALYTTVLLARLVVALRSAQKRKASSRPVDVDGVTVYAARDIGPAVIGLRPMEIIVPEWVIDADHEIRSLVIRHEVEHRLARDPYLLLVANVLTALIPWNPALWLQTRRLRLAIEIDCDQRVLQTRGSWRQYARLLVEIAQKRSAAQQLAPALLEPSSNLARRIAAMRTRPTLSPFNAACLAVIAAIAFALACTIDSPETTHPVEASTAPATQAGKLTTAQLAEMGSTMFEFQVEKPATPKGEHHLKYPAELKDAAATVLAQYVVDQRGHVDIPTFKVLNAADPRLARIVKEALATWEYEPAMVGDRKVRQLVQQEFQFVR